MIAPIKKVSLNVLGNPLAPCCNKLKTGWYRNGSCETDEGDHGKHVVCTVMTEKFLAFSKKMGNDLSTPHPEFEFYGLKEGDCWCLCASRWQEAFESDMAPQVKLESCEQSALEVIQLDNLKAFAAKPS
jgi:uncharacterized protein (DUF2237 family)